MTNGSGRLEVIVVVPETAPLPVLRNDCDKFWESYYGRITTQQPSCDAKTTDPVTV